MTWRTVVTRAAGCKWSTGCHACRQKVTPTSLIFWYLLNQDSILTAHESCAEPKEYSECSGAL